jgi:hypothetical protein
VSDRSELSIVCLVLTAAALVLGAPLVGRSGAAGAANLMMAAAAAAGLAAFAVAARDTLRAMRRGRSEIGEGGPR